MKRTAAFGIALMTLVAASTALVLAQRPAATFPVIVVFNDEVSFDSFAPMFRADARAAANPAAWNYVNRGVAGRIQALEAREGFQAENVYSAALRGFSARLTARQIALLEDDPDVASIESDGEMHVTAQTLPWGID